MCARVGAKTDNVSGVGWYLRLVQNDVQHGASGIGFSAISAGKDHRLENLRRNETRYISGFQPLRQVIPLSFVLFEIL
jgi:hypothetical protein